MLKLAVLPDAAGLARADRLAAEQFLFAHLTPYGANGVLRLRGGRARVQADGPSSSSSSDSALAAT